MAETLTSRAAVSQSPTAPRGVTLAEIDGVGKIDLRGDPNDRAFMSAVGRVLDLLLPTEPCQSAMQGEIAALWIGPDHWLVTGPKARTPELAASLTEALRDSHVAVTDISAGRTVFRLSGPNATDVLAKGCPLDLHPRTVKPGHVAGSVLAKTTALVHLRTADSIDIHVGRSFADYAWAWLEEAGREYGLSVS